MDTREYLEGLLYHPAEIDKWLAGEEFPFSKYDPELGFLHRTRRRHDGIDDSTPSTPMTQMTPGALSGTRNFPAGSIPTAIASPTVTR